MRSSEQESFLKSFALYFITIGVLIALLLHHSYDEDVHTLEEQLFLEMKNFNFNFAGEKFGIDFVPKATKLPLLELHHNDAELYALFPLPSDGRYLLKVFYPRPQFDRQTRDLLLRYLLAALLLSVVVALMAYGFARYTLRPLRRALTLTDRFIKDIIHDLNTPVSAILINTAMLPKEDKAVQRIEKSARSIGMLYRNLQEYQGGLPQQRSRFRLDTLAAERFAFFEELYPALTFRADLAPTELTANADALARILDNLLSNACKYNRSGGDVALRLDADSLRVENSTATPIRNPRRLFDRFYKESERGIGIGLHIVKKLCDEEGFTLSVSQSDARVAFVCRFRPQVPQGN